MNVVTGAVVRALARTREAHAEDVYSGAVTAVPVPSTLLLTDALAKVTWSDAYAAPLPTGARTCDPQDWADAVFRHPPGWVRILFGLRELAVRAVGIEAGDRHAFDTLDRRREEVLLGVDQRHLSFRASVFIDRDRVVVSTVVAVHNRRGRTYSRLVRQVHPWVVRSLLAGAAQRLTAAPCRPLTPPDPLPLNSVDLRRSHTGGTDVDRHACTHL